MMKIKLYLLAFLLCIPFTLIGAEKQENTNIYSGGMLILQPSWLTMQNPHGIYETRGGGIGGILRFYIGQNFAAGIFGGSQSANYETEKSDESYINLGHGGGFLGFTLKHGKIRYNASMGVGRGSVKNLHVEYINDNELIDSFLYNYGTIMYVPFVSIDYKLTKRLLFTCQFSYFFGDNNNYQNRVLQIGLLFNR